MEIHYIYQLEKHRVNRMQMSEDFSYAGLEATVEKYWGLS